MNKDPLPEDLRVFSAVLRKSSFSGAAQELGVSPAYVTKRIRILESALNTKLFHRTTRRVVVTEGGERVYHWALKILDDIDHLVEEIGITRTVPRGSLRVCSSFGFGRRVVAPALSALVEKFPLIQVRFEVFDRLVDVATEGFDQVARQTLPFRAGSRARTAKPFWWFGLVLMRRLLLLDVLANDSNRCATTATGKVAGRPKCSIP